MGVAGRLAEYLVPQVVECRQHAIDDVAREQDIARRVDLAEEAPFLVTEHPVANLAADGIAVIVVSSDLMEVMGIADRILVMSEGAITGELNRDEANEARLLQLALPRTRG